jgi:hypothetical protein
MAPSASSPGGAPASWACAILHPHPPLFDELPLPPGAATQLPFALHTAGETQSLTLVHIW